MDKWNKLTQTGNTAFKKRYFNLAYICYNLALNDIDTNFSYCPDVNAALAAKMVSHHNLAAIYLQLRDHESAHSQYKAAQEFIDALAHSSRTNSQVKKAALRASQLSYCEWLNYLNSHKDQKPLRCEFTEPPKQWLDSANILH